MWGTFFSENPAADSVQTFARWGIICPGFGSDFCTVGYDMPRIRFRLLHGGINDALNSVQTFARWGK